MQDLLSMDRQLQPSIHPSKSRGKQILLKTTHLSDYFMYHFPRVFKKEITMRFPRQLSHASFSRGLHFLVKRVQLALWDAIQFLVIKKNTHQRLLCCNVKLPLATTVYVNTDSNNRNFCNDTTFWKYCPKKVVISGDKYPLTLTLKSQISYPVKTKWFIRVFQFSEKSVNIYNKIFAKNSCHFGLDGLYRTLFILK